LEFRRVLFRSSTTLWLGAQPLKEIPLRFKLEAADSAYYKNDYYNALEWYNEVYREDRQNIYLNRLAELYFIVRDYKRAERWLSRLIERDKANEYPKARLYYAQALKMNGKRSEEHTSELQSRENLVCRLLLEKKKENK